MRDDAIVPSGDQLPPDLSSAQDDRAERALVVALHIIALYPRCVPRSPAPHRSPTPGLVLGLIITLAAVVAYSGYITWQVSGLRELQNNLVDRNRKDSLQLLRIQNDLNTLALAMRDMLDNNEPYPLTAWTAQFQRIRADLDDALRKEEQVAVADRTPEQRQYLGNSMAQFWDAVDRTFALAANGKQDEARSQIQLSLQARQAALSTAVARLLVQNNESEEQAALRIGEIYDRVQRQVYLFLTLTLVAILLTGLYSIRSNRQLFAQLAALSAQRSELAQKLISTQESTLRHISRELHDEFGQILTAVGAMLSRAGNQVPEGSPLRAELREVAEIAQSTLDKVRSLSQALHPVMLDESGLESTLDWYLPVVERQAGIHISYEKSGTAFPVDGNAAIHVYRVLQEALNNVTRHSGASQAWVRLQFLPQTLKLEVEDHGSGFTAPAGKQGIGLVAMRERAELLGGALEFARPTEGGTLMRLTVPRERLGERLDSHGG
ncbi:MAG TPA: ATP-binding protein [Terriglobales bacterium]|jgi:signal transduction histidine kinase|nr:ATP-binding protein [Terriglobales bacterium]